MRLNLFILIIILISGLLFAFYKLIGKLTSKKRKIFKKSRNDEKIENKSGKDEEIEHKSQLEEKIIDDQEEEEPPKIVDEINRKRGITYNAQYRARSFINKWENKFEMDENKNKTKEISKCVAEMRKYWKARFNQIILDNINKSYVILRENVTNPLFHAIPDEKDKYNLKKKRWEKYTQYIDKNIVPEIHKWLDNDIPSIENLDINQQLEWIHNCCEFYSLFIIVMVSIFGSRYKLKDFFSVMSKKDNDLLKTLIKLPIKYLIPGYVEHGDSDSQINWIKENTSNEFILIWRLNQNTDKYITIYIPNPLHSEYYGDEYNLTEDIVFNQIMHDLQKLILQMYGNIDVRWNINLYYVVDENRISKISPKNIIFQISHHVENQSGFFDFDILYNNKLVDII